MLKLIIYLWGDQRMGNFTNARFNGSDYHPSVDDHRLRGQIRRVYEAMIDGEWRTLDEIASVTKDPHASISAQLRHLRKERFGSYIVDKRARGERKHGLFEYRLLVPREPKQREMF